jgi:GTP:adenosylcobinamide-phosphate guanylyltransferase
VVAVVDAVVLAGAANAKRLRAVSREPYEALIPVADRRMVDFVVAALEESPSVTRAAVVGPVPQLKYLEQGKVKAVLPCAGSVMDNLRQGLEWLQPQGYVLVATSDIPLLTAAAVEDFLKRAQETQADFYYSIVEKGVGEARYPGVKRTYVRLKDGTFTGGNLFLFHPRIVDRVWRLAEEMVRLRKQPLKMCSLLGWGQVLRLVLGQLTIAAVEQRFAEIAGAVGKAVISPYPEVGIDVDKPSDYELVQRFMGWGGKTWSGGAGLNG